ncbi:N-6 DNA methylase [Atopobacter phocae]|uniref:N-6 DNA methylase n=1 Tax=Atopobacter phocae TaxID=136492 RepID=UPI001FE00C4E|nr:N-6 DNA methylase [Atopobacter phocae]
MLLTVAKHLDEHEQRTLRYYGKEKNTATYILTRMNLLLHSVRPERMAIKMTIHSRKIGRKIQNVRMNVSNLMQSF